MTARRTVRPDWRRIALAVVVALLGLLVGAQALIARTSDPAALGERAREALGTGDLPAAVAFAQRALRRDPTVVAAVQTLGLAAQAKGDGARAARLLGYADHLSRRDLQTHLWTIEREVARGDVDAALREYDLALRTSIGARELLFPVLTAAIAESPVAQALLRRFRLVPLWRADFLAYLATDARVDPTVAVRFLETARGGVAIAPEYLSVLISRAIDAGDYATAWRAYRLVRRDADPRQVRDPGFARLADAPSAFDWTPASQGGIAAQAVRQDGASRLEIDAEPGTAGRVIEQLQLLPPGRYRLAVDAGSVSEGGGLVWALDCRDGPNLARIAMPSAPARRYATAPFTISASCRVQHLTLTVDASTSPSALHAEIGRVTVAPAAG
jgi:tetratricopeptide (TPR) repeat protein